MIETNVFVSHGPFVSQFYLKDAKFELRADLQFRFDSPVKSLFKRKLGRKGVEGHRDPAEAGDARAAKEAEALATLNCVGVLLENGEIHVISSSTPSEAKSWAPNEAFEGTKIPGTMFFFSQDPVQYRSELVLATAPEPAEDEAGEDQKDDGEEETELDPDAEEENKDSSSGGGPDSEATSD